MVETLSMLPAGFWAAIALLLGGALWAKSRLRDGTGLPILAVLGTVAAWYVGDAFYNNYANNHAKLFEADILASAWWQVVWFLAVFLVTTPYLHRWLNRRHLRLTSGVLGLIRHGTDQRAFQAQLDRAFWGCGMVWAILAIIAIILLKGDAIYFFFPFLGVKASPWTHGRIGAGFDALSVIAIYMQLLVAGIFGVVVALSTNRRVRSLAVLCCVLCWPYFIFDRTRNTMLAVVIPAVLGWVFLRLRGSILKKVIALAGCFILVNGWMAFVIANRTTSTIVGALREEGFSLRSTEKVHHEGLNMYEELCWINTFIEQGVYRPNWGSRYWAELVNPIPRGLWPGKPMIGIDYAIIRGQGGGDQSGAGVYATISTGLIGQGIVNFGRIFGPAFSALLMSLWVVWLARLDLRIQELGRLPLYGLGLILTFNLGRDITLITLYPFVFGGLAVWWLDRRPPASEYGSAAIGGSRTSLLALAATRSNRSRLRRVPATPSARRIRKPLRRFGLKVRRGLRRPGGRISGTVFVPSGILD